MVNEITWDSRFFNRKIGELKVDTNSQHQIENDVKIAKENGFKYITCKIKSQDTSLIKYLESLGFYLSDIGVTWAIESNKFLNESNIRNSMIEKSIFVATEENIPMLKKIIKTLFSASRFYSDPFYSKGEADNLYQAWIENSVKGIEADIVYCIQDTGFITCKKVTQNMGKIILIGIQENFRGKGVGKILVNEAMEWFKKSNINLVNVRTQLSNISSMNFYAKLGLYIQEYDLVFAKIF